MSENLNAEIVVLEVKFKKFIIPFLFLFLIVAPVIVFFVTLPFVLSFNFESVLLYAPISLSNKKLIFYSTLALYPYVIMLLPQIKVGKYCFYSDRLEIKPFVWPKKTFFYKKINSTLYSNSLGYGHILITEKPIVKFFHYPIENILNRYIKGFNIVLHSSWLKDSSKIDQVIDLLKNNSSNFDVKYFNWREK